jgi:hypothetical protein
MAALEDEKQWKPVKSPKKWIWQADITQEHARDKIRSMTFEVLFTCKLCKFWQIKEETVPFWFYEQKDVAHNATSPHISLPYLGSQASRVGGASKCDSPCSPIESSHTSAMLRRALSPSTESFPYCRECWECICMSYAKDILVFTKNSYTTLAT